MFDEIQIEDVCDDSNRHGSPDPSEFPDDQICDCLKEYWAAVDECGGEEWSEEDEISEL